MSEIKTREMVLLLPVAYINISLVCSSAFAKTAALILMPLYGYLHFCRHTRKMCSGVCFTYYQSIFDSHFDFGCSSSSGLLYINVIHPATEDQL